MRSHHKTKAKKVITDGGLEEESENTSYDVND